MENKDISTIGMDEMRGVYNLLKLLHPGIFGQMSMHLFFEIAYNISIDDLINKLMDKLKFPSFNPMPINIQNIPLAPPQLQPQQNWNWIAGTWTLSTTQQ